MAATDSSRAPAIVAICSSEALTESPAGPALRAAGLARGLAAHGLEVVVAAPPGSRAPEGGRLAVLDDIPALVRSGATLVASGFLLERYPALADAEHLVVDAAGPFLLENLVVHQHEPAARRRRILTAESAVFARLLAAADVVLCAHPRQRDLTFGFMLASGAIRPELADSPEGLDAFFLRVPFGPTGTAEPLEHTPEPGRLRLVWPGGLWDWLDPLTLVDAVAKARARGTEVTAELWGARSNDPLVPPSRAAAQVAERAAALQIADAIEIVSWVPHGEREARLANADAAITLDPGGTEARYAFRTRLVDALAAGLPVIATEGELVADEAAARGAGFTVRPGDPDDLAELLIALASDPVPLELAREKAPAIADGWRYERTVADLAAWCRAPQRARAGTPTSSGPEAADGPLARARRLAGRIQRASNSSTSAS